MDKMKSDHSKLVREAFHINKGGRNGRSPRKSADQHSSSGTVPTCENPVTWPGIEPGSPWSEASVLVAQPPRPPKTSEVSIEQRRNTRAGETSDPQDIPHTGVIVRHDFPHVKILERPRREPNPVRLSGRLSPTKEKPGSVPGRVAPDFRMWQSCWTMLLVGVFSRDMPFPPPLQPGAVPYLPRFILIDSQDLDVNSRPNLFTHSIISSH
ncbi:hypothetical protein PR048_021286 [Dryococelus australis]|uniref:Uncharacterized protein n=1 Tax=Dryococelus australis TaxID=614101 RepID=A0ABQ9GXV6_9NEOP|nr:hypothetical protein PR048_021286 [Dryococelus australis]